VYEIDVSSLSDALRSGLALAGGALRLDPEAFVAVQTQDGGLRVAFGVAFLAGLSMMLGQSVVLITNHISPRRFIWSLVRGALFLVAGFLLWGISSWLIAWTLLDVKPLLAPFLAILSLAHAPLLFGLLVLIPYVGILLDKLLRGYVLLALVVGLHAGYGAGFWEAVVCTVAGWLLIQLVFHLGLVGLERRRRYPWWTDSTVEAVEVREQRTEQFAQEHGLLPGAGDEQDPTGTHQ